MNKGRLEAFRDGPGFQRQGVDRGLSAGHSIGICRPKGFPRAFGCGGDHVAGAGWVHRKDAYRLVQVGKKLRENTPAASAGPGNLA
jgi:hypothetical protein